MVYLDAAATTIKKPPGVLRAMKRALKTCGGAGRGGHKPAQTAAEVIYDLRKTAADYFSMQNPERVILTHNATHALNICINSLFDPERKVLISGFEHNAVTRPLYHRNNDNIIIAKTPLFEPQKAVESFKNILEKADIGLCICTQVSNVFGYILPVMEIFELCKMHSVPMVIDASQSAGVLPIQGDCGAFWCMPGHKSLYGPQGTGLLLLPPKADLEPFIIGGTGSNSRNLAMPDFYPDRFEAGTHNAIGAAGLSAGVKTLSSETQGEFLDYAVEKLQEIPKIKIYSNLDCQTNVLSFTIAERNSEEIADFLGKRNICVRGGLHCAPLAHKTAGTEKHGTVRLSFSRYSKKRDIDEVCKALK